MIIILYDFGSLLPVNFCFLWIQSLPSTILLKYVLLHPIRAHFSLIYPRRDSVRLSNDILDCVEITMLMLSLKMLSNHTINNDIIINMDS